MNSIQSTKTFANRVAKDAPPEVELLFGNPVMYSGCENLTIRLGDKWLKLFNDGVDRVVIKNQKGEKLRNAILTRVAYLPYFMIPEAWLAFEHDPACKEFNGLWTAMKLAYGNDFDAGSMVTALWFIPLRTDRD